MREHSHLEDGLFLTGRLTVVVRTRAAAAPGGRRVEIRGCGFV